jgi:enoyl-CoA hydratase/carnithine racemase
LGLVPDLAGTSRLIGAVGYARALEWCATGRVVTATEALASGLVSRVVEPHELNGAVDELVGSLLAVDADTGFAIKDLLRDAEERSATDQQARERAAQLQRLQALASRHAVDLSRDPSSDAAR